MLKELIEKQANNGKPMSTLTYHDITDMATDDIKYNRLWYNKRTTQKDVIEISSQCLNTYRKATK